MEKREASQEKEDIIVEESSNHQQEQVHPEADPAFDESCEQEQQDTSESTQQVTSSDWEQKLKESEDRYLRLQADYDNYRKRTQKERGGIIAKANKEVMLSVLPVIDNLERALSLAQPEDPFTKGVEMVYKQLVEEMQKHGLSPIEAVNQAFDPNYHQAVAKEATADVASDMVLEEYQKGYLLNNEVLRPSMVKVSE